MQNCHIMKKSSSECSILRDNEATVFESAIFDELPSDTNVTKLRFFLSGSLKKEADETLFLELACRGDDLSRLRDDTEPDTPPTEAEIVKIG